MASAEWAGRADLISLCLQVQVPGQGKEAAAPLAALHPVPDFVALFSRTEGVSTPSGFLGVGMRAFLLRVHSRASGLQFLAGPGEEIRKETPCPAAGKA